MATINRGRVVIGAVAGGVVWFVWSFVVNQFILSSHYLDAQEAGLLLGEPRYPFIGLWVVTLFLLAGILAWLYASVRGAWGPGPVTALKLGILVGFVGGFPGNLAHASWSTVERVLPLWWMLDLWIGAVLAALVAGWLYRES